MGIQVRPENIKPARMVTIDKYQNFLGVHMNLSKNRVGVIIELLTVYISIFLNGHFHSKAKPGGGWGGGGES